MQYASDSRNTDIAEGLLAWFLEINRHDCFAACLYACYDLLRPDYILELSWRNNIMDFAMPFLVQVIREYIGRVERLETKGEEAESEKQEQPMMMSMFCH